MSFEAIQAGESLQRDIELNGELNRATQSGAKFALLLAMLEEDPLRRPQYDEDKEPPIEDPLLTHHYRSAPLCATQADWHNADIESVLLHQNSQDIFLWRALHPQPLSVYNDVKRLDEEVKANCSLAVQRRLQSEVQNKIKVDPTQLYNVVQQAQQFS